MWQHEILESLFYEPEEIQTDLRKYIRKFIIKYLPKATCFYFGEISKTIEKMLISARKNEDNEMQINKNLPYEICLYEMILPNADNQNIYNKHTIMIYDYKKPIRGMLTKTMFIFDDMFGWRLAPYCFMFDNDGWKTYALCEEKHYSKAVMTPTLACRISVVRSEILTRIINTHNIITKTIRPPEALNKKRLKKGKEPLREYKILEVVKGVPKTKDAGREEWGYRSPAQTAFHMCRGHFKTYGEDAPLFGKYTGTFWWQAQARGHKENGEIIKDYSVTVKE